MMSKKSPQLRFEGFTDDWEERKLSEIADIMDGDRGKNYPNGDDFSETGHTLFMSATNVTKNGFKFDETQYISEEKSDSLGNGKIIEDDLILTSRGTVGNLALYDADAKRQIPFARINSGMLILRKKQNESAEFVLQYLKSLVGIKQLNLISFGSAQPQITKKDISKYKVQIPNFDEQTKIGTFFKQLDTLITLHQRKLDLLKEQKKGYLQKMFPKNGARVPELRFAGFADDWEERKLKELFQPSKNKNNNGLYNQKDILAASLGTELIPKRTFFGLKSTKESVKNYRIVKTGDLIYTKSPIKGFPNGIIRSNKGNVGIVPPLYCVYTLQKDINSSIIQLYFEDKNRLDLYLFPLVNVGARNNVNITDLEFLEGKVTIPKSYEEQSKIVQFMEQLNTTIALHQRKLDLLKEQKKGFLQKMFV